MLFLLAPGARVAMPGLGCDRPRATEVRAAALLLQAPQLEGDRP
jgi:hypothetical protein